MRLAGYAWLRETLLLSALPLRRPATVQPVTRIQENGETLAVPSQVVPVADDLLGHILFALKHEGVNLAILAQALPQIPTSCLEAGLAESPNGIYIRKACFLREALTHDEVRQHSPVKGGFIPLFDPRGYVTMPGERNSRWRVEFNGLGTIGYCATVERTAEIESLLELDILGRARAFIKSLPAGLMERAIQIAYHNEAEESFAIEKESPSEGKARKFISLLRQAHERKPLSEEYLVRLQNVTISNPFEMATAFRDEQNHLANGLQGAAGVTYVPPQPELCRELMELLMAFGNEASTRMDPLVAAGIVSFGFVYLHPFMDGNGRLSRFLIHQTLCRAGALDNGLLLPVSVAMKREARRYMETLQQFSRPCREFWDVRRLDQIQNSLTFTGDPAIYRFWDATAAVQFTLEMAQQALEVDLREQTIYLRNYDTVERIINDRHDVRGSDLAILVRTCLKDNGVLSKTCREQFENTVQPEVLDHIEQVTQALLLQQSTDKQQQDVVECLA